MCRAMSSVRGRLCGAVFAVVLLGGASGCGVSVWVRTSTTVSTPQAQAVADTPQRPGTCQIAPPNVHFPTGEWTATETILTTNAVDGCAGERLVRPWDFRRVCKTGTCNTYLFTYSYYGGVEAQIVPEGRDRYAVNFPSSLVPCPHRPGEDTGTNRSYSTMTLWWSPDKQTLLGSSTERQVGPCGGGPDETSSYVVRRTDPVAKQPAPGP